MLDFGRILDEKKEHPSASRQAPIFPNSGPNRGPIATVPLSPNWNFGHKPMCRRTIKTPAYLFQRISPHSNAGRGWHNLIGNTAGTDSEPLFTHPEYYPSSY